MTALLPLALWVPILDGDPAAAAIYDGHYSSAKSRARRRARGAMLFLGPGEKRERYRKDGQFGVECAIFSNRGSGLSSDLIRAADALADARWGRLRHFTFVNPAETESRRSRHGRPGQCFIHAGWRECGETKRGLAILERAA